MPRIPVSSFFVELSDLLLNLTGCEVDLVELHQAGLLGVACVSRNTSYQTQLTFTKKQDACWEFIFETCLQAQSETQLQIRTCPRGLASVALPYGKTARGELFLLIGRVKAEQVETLTVLSRLLHLLRPEFGTRILQYDGKPRRLFSAPVRRACSYLESNFDASICLKSLAQDCAVSKTYLSHCFNEEVGVSITSYLNSIRIQKAKLYLCQRPELSITEICFMVGFQSVSQFNRVFKKQVGVSPSAFRQETVT
jgi:AraC-like DNA-binding protein